MVGNDITSEEGWIKSATAEHEIPTDHTSWLYSDSLGDPTLSDPNLHLNEDFEPEVKGILEDIKHTSKETLKDNTKLIERFTYMNPKNKESVLRSIDFSKAEFLAQSLPDDQLYEEY